MVQLRLVMSSLESYLDLFQTILVAMANQPHQDVSQQLTAARL